VPQRGRASHPARLVAPCEAGLRDHRFADPPLPVAVPPIRRRASKPVTESEVDDVQDREGTDQGKSTGEDQTPLVGARPWLSASGATSRTSTSPCLEPSGPSFDLRSQPELHSTVAEVDDGARHVLVAPLVQADAVAMRELEYVGDGLSIDEVFGSDLWAHAAKATSVDGYVRRER
jgi:hypothetical protein